MSTAKRNVQHSLFVCVKCKYLIIIFLCVCFLYFALFFLIMLFIISFVLFVCLNFLGKRWRKPYSSTSELTFCVCVYVFLLMFVWRFLIRFCVRINCPFECVPYIPPIKQQQQKKTYTHLQHIQTFVHIYIKRVNQVSLLLLFSVAISFSCSFSNN